MKDSTKSTATATAVDLHPPTSGTNYGTQDATVADGELKVMKNSQHTKNTASYDKAITMMTSTLPEELQVGKQ